VFLSEVFEQHCEKNEAEEPENVIQHASKVIKYGVSLVAHGLEIHVILVLLGKVEHVVVDGVGGQQFKVRDASEEGVKSRRILGEVYVQQGHLNNQLHYTDHAPEHLEGSRHQ
jgi:hypothetical protein